MNNNTFYQVFLEGSRMPVFKHLSLQSAENEAKRLAREHKRRAFVLVTIKAFEINEFTVTDCRPDNSDLPF